ncbi:ABC transporter ATP-binding protein [Sphingobacteriales bacterium UPWRP_1]|nr:ABC transporter ATP-binding protein [Sphingobacteriales bacterium TSM_CSS]PSJ76035.1 ABC transporter ATP-binding protein [Sphingobacteriales bacterium UPWRP_1]
MKIELNKIGKRFRLEWIFKNVTYTFETGNAYAILGPNGSGKSTLLQIIAGCLSPSSGKIRYAVSGTETDVLSVYPFLSLAAPYLELIEEFSLLEMVQFHEKLKPFTNRLTSQQAIDRMELSHARNKQLRFFSSGMKQRVKLGLALLSDTPAVLLDEPTTNLDAKAVDWYLNLVNSNTSQRLIVVASNQPQEYGFCSHLLHITDFVLN